MNPFKSFARFFSKKNAMSVGQYIAGGFARWMDRDIRVYADEGYRRNVIVSRCIQIVSQSLASVDLKVEQNGEAVPDHPLAELLNKPNPRTAGASFFEHLASFNRMAGNGYVEVIKDATGMPRELYLWTPYNMEVIQGGGDSPWPQAYRWKQGEYSRTWEIDNITGQSDLLQWKTFHPFDVDFGMSPMEPAAYNVDQHNASSEWNQALLQNSAAPDGMLTTNGNLDDGQYERLREQISNNMSGPVNARQPFIGEGGLQWTQLSMSPKDMDWLNGRQANAIDIAAAYGVPVQLLGIQGSQTFANFEQARLSLWEDNVLVLLDQLVDLLNMWLVPMYNDAGLSISYDANSIEALDFKRTASMQALNGLTYLTINEKREMAGFDKVDEDGADEIWMAGGLLPLSFDVDDIAGDDNSEGSSSSSDDDDDDDEEEEVTEEVVKQLRAIGYTDQIARLMVNAQSKK